MHCPLTDIQADLRSIGLLDIKLPRKEIIYKDERTDKRTDRRTGGQTLRTTTIGNFSKKKLNSTVN